MARLIVSRIAVITALAAAIGASAASAQSSTGQITVLYDAFGKTSTMTKDWGFAALVEYGGKRILVSTPANTWRSSLTISKPRVSISSSSISSLSRIAMGTIRAGLIIF